MEQITLYAVYVLFVLIAAEWARGWKVGRSTDGLNDTLSRLHQAGAACTRLRDVCIRAAALLGVLSPALAHAAPPALPDHLVGNLGAALFATRATPGREHEYAQLLPFAYLDYQRFFARVDTVGIKTLPLANGYLELVARDSVEGFRPRLHNAGKRRDPLLAGLGTFQETPIGGVFLYALRDVRHDGTLLEASYAAEIAVPGATLYPQIGIERRSARYEQRLNGLNVQEAQAAGTQPYVPGSSVTPVAALSADVRLSGPWMLNMQLRRAWLSQGVARSPLVGASHLDSGFVGLSYEFK